MSEMYDFVLRSPSREEAIAGPAISRSGSVDTAHIHKNQLTFVQ
jgi:hypothetical protein